MRRAAGWRKPERSTLLAWVVGQFELEAGLISQRTKAALAAAKASGVKLGNPQLRAGTPALALAAPPASSAQAK